MSIHRQRHILIVSVLTALDDAQLVELQRDLSPRVGESRTSMVILDVAAVDVVDSFAANVLATCATIARLRGADLTVVGLQPDVALTMVELGLGTGRAHAALDIEDGMDYAANQRNPPV